MFRVKNVYIDIGRWSKKDKIITTQLLNEPQRRQPHSFAIIVKINNADEKPNCKYVCMYVYWTLDYLNKTFMVDINIKLQRISLCLTTIVITYF